MTNDEWFDLLGETKTYEEICEVVQMSIDGKVYNEQEEDNEEETLA